MAEHLEQLEAKIGELVDRYVSLKERFDESLKVNEELRTELSSLRQEFDAFRLINNDRTRLVKTKLGSVLGRIDELENLHL